MILARDETTGTLAGMSEALPTGFFVCIAVGRRFWGTRVAELLAATTMSRLVRCGRTELFSIVRVGNRPSLALHERMGWRQIGMNDIYISRPVGR